MTIFKVIGKTAVILILCFVLITSCSSPVDDNEEQTLSFLWEVSSDTNTVYILGSVHVARADIYPLAEAIENAYALAEYLVVEVDINAISELEMAALLMEKGMYPTGESLQDNITENLYSRLYDRVSELDPTGLMLSSINLFEPWVVATLISDLDYMALGYEVEYGIETYFLNKAEADRKDILELESAEFQLDIFDSMSYEIQIAWLEDAVDNPVTENEMEALFEAWSTGDVEMMERIVFEDIEEDENYRELLSMVNDERNFLMVDKIEKYLEADKTYFVVVGTAHLVGENGIINLLDSKGYTIEQQ
ncbi:MAG TPA: TraB/GumN family protein [Dehalococcoidia bacterium]|nr:TraB/GumN family protein [Dehalococcoidia bacterium]